MSFLENIINNIDNLILIDELGNEVWSNSEIASRLKNRKSGIVQYDNKYYQPIVKMINHSAQKHYLIQYADVTKIIIAQSKNENNKIYTYKNEQNS